MIKSIHDILKELRDASIDQRDKGDLFEKLTKRWLEVDPVYRDFFDKVWLYGEWAEEAGFGKNDTGIDLVARESETGHLFAIQCKFYASEAYLDKKEIDSFFTASGKEPFRGRIIFSTTDNWSKNAEDALENQQIPVTRIRVQDLDDSGVDWASFSLKRDSELALLPKKTPRPHQVEALGKALEHFQTQDRGKMIMACGTGKTYTSLQIAEELVPDGGTMLFLVPSIALLSQTLKEWKRESKRDMTAYAVCSDSKVGRRKDDEDFQTPDLAYPATTSTEKLAAHFKSNLNKGSGFTVIFSTYQSIDVISKAQSKGVPAFDLIVCDEAHRTTGVTYFGATESAFVRIHDNSFISGKKRLYMTATPRIYAEQSKQKANEIDAAVTSMDDELMFGEEFYRLNFGDAVKDGLLSDYKVLVLAVSKSHVNESLQTLLSQNGELNLDDAAKIVGCYNGLRKRSENPDDFTSDPTPMKRAVAFAKNIAESKKLAQMFQVVTDNLNDLEDEDEPLRTQADHVDGTFNMLTRNQKLDWLKDERTENTVRVLSNAKCLTEGVDVPALDAVLFLNPRDSQIDVVQSVGRVMRKSENKKYGYVILPVTVPSGQTPEEALEDNNAYRVVWQVLQALRSHDERFDAMVHKIALNGDTDDRVKIIGVGIGEEDQNGDSTTPKKQDTALALNFNFDELKDAIIAKLVVKVGRRGYWENWAKDVANITDSFRIRITGLVSTSKSSASKEFEKFLKGLQDNLNPSVTKEDAIEMLAQHLITKPIFEALFDGYSFSNDNPVSMAMQRMIEILSESNVDLEADSLENFYTEMKTTIGGINTSDGRQKIIKDLYEKFFKLAFPSAAAQLGIVYTPNEVVDFMLQSVNDILQKEFKSDLGDRNVQILDPFTGTGTFVARLLQLGIIPKDKLEHKYMNEIHANEIVLLAYYIAAVNIEETFHSVMGGEYKPFEGIVLTDTFQMDEADDSDEIAGLEVFPENNQKVKGQRKRDIRVVIGNPPYALAQASGNENAERATYPKLDTRIQQTYAARSKASLTKSLSNSYIRAIRWASDRIADEGVICFVSNGGFIDDNSADGLRQALVEEFSSVYIYNLRGNQRTSGETSRKEGGKIFGSGSRNTIAISILVKNPKSGSSGGIFYRDIGDYLTREQKLAKLKREISLSKVEWDQLVPNLDGDWINQKDATFTSLPSLSHKADGPYSVFGMYSRSLLTSRDSWAYNFSRKSLEANVSSMIDFYNEQVRLLRELSKTQKISEDTVKEKVSLDPTKISWDGNLVKLASKLKELTFSPEDITEALYRPFTKHWVYLNKSFLNSAYQIPSLFPKGESNFGFIVPGPGSAVPFSVLMTNRPSDLSQFGGQTNAHFFARYTFPEDVEEDALFGSTPLTDGKADNITDECFADFQSVYGKHLTKDDIFFYVYGLLHSPEYRQRFESDLRKGLPRIMKVADFKGFSQAGRALSELHMHYETADEYPLTEDALPKAKSEVVKMRFGKSSGKEDRSKLVLNETLTLHGIPEQAYEYKIGSRSPIEWLVERYVRKIDKDTGLLVDANAWGLERSQEDYLVSLIKRVVNISVRTVEIVEKLPGLDLHPKAVS